MNDWQIKIQVNLGRANKFTRYNSDDSRFYTIADLVEKIDIGAYEVVIAAYFTSPFGTYLNFRDTYFINVYEPGPLDPNIEPDKDGENNPIELDELDLDARNNFVPEEIEKSSEGGDGDGSILPARPIPFISHITETGRVTIAWDRKMETPSKFEQIPETKV